MFSHGGSFLADESGRPGNRYRNGVPRQTSHPLSCTCYRGCFLSYGKLRFRILRYYTIKVWEKSPAGCVERGTEISCGQHRLGVANAFCAFFNYKWVLETGWLYDRFWIYYSIALVVCRVGKNGIWDVVLLGKGEKIAGICVFSPYLCFSFGWHAFFG